MTATNHTSNYNLSQFQATDRPTWQNDYNGDMSKIDAAIHNIASSGGLREVAVSSPLSGNGTSSSPISINLSSYATTSDAHVRPCGARWIKPRRRPEITGLTAAQLDTMWVDDNGIVRTTK